jgi:ABC-type transporter Mla maintaining outer membrane lipid asymmetry ATPase subunit MlaF
MVGITSTANMETMTARGMAKVLASVRYGGRDGAHISTETDEPSVGLAPPVVEEIFRIIGELHARGTTILLVEQNAHQALHIADRACVMEVGRVVLGGSAPDCASTSCSREPI